MVAPTTLPKKPNSLSCSSKASDACDTSCKKECSPDNKKNSISFAAKLHGENDSAGQKASCSELCPTTDSISSVSTPTSPGSVSDDNVEELKKSETEVLANRDKFVTYWKNASKAFGLSNEGMMLNDKASKTGYVEADRKEIIEWLHSALVMERKASSPFLVNRLIEIGAGIGRMTPLLQPMCEEIVCVDFIQEYIETNEKRHFDSLTRPNDQFLCRDATTLRYNEGHFDVVFWNWLLMYLGDKEVKDFVLEAAKWLKVGGFMFCRESCGEPSTKAERSWAAEGNPTEYRPYPFYTWLLTEHLEQHGFKVEVVLKEAVVSIYKNTTGTDGQRCWLIKRIA